MRDRKFVVDSLHKAGQVVVHVVKHHVDAAFHIIALVGCAA